MRSHTTAGDSLAVLLKLNDWSWILGTYLIVGFFHIMVFFAAATLESLLWQKQSQYSMAAGALMRLVGVFYLIANNNLDLQTLVILELVTEAGNTVVLGEVELIGGFEGLEPRLLGRTPWRHDLTNRIQEREKRPLRNALGLGVHSGGVDVRFSRLLTKRRLAAWVGVAPRASATSSMMVVSDS